MLKHEEDARKIIPSACNFQPVNNMYGRTIGWIFSIPRGEGESPSDRYSWVNLDGEVPKDTYSARFRAKSFLKSYQKAKQQNVTAPSKE